MRSCQPCFKLLCLIFCNAIFVNGFYGPTRALFSMSTGGSTNKGPKEQPSSSEGTASRRDALGKWGAALGCGMAGADILASATYKVSWPALHAEVGPQVEAGWDRPGDLPDAAYIRLGTKQGRRQPMCRILNGMWQVSGGHGYSPEEEKSIRSMNKLVSEGFTTFDLADIYGPAEDIAGKFSTQQIVKANPDHQQLFTKWVPRPQRVNKDVVDEALGRTMSRMKSERIDLLQFHWWDYSNKYYQDALHILQERVDDGTIRQLALTNFDTFHLKEMRSQGVDIVSNQVQYSVLDQRPAVSMVPYCRKENVKLLAYGTLLGGFFSEYWLGRENPDPYSLGTSSLRKYYYMIAQWGGWSLFQQLLTAMKQVADKHDVSIANVAVRWVLDQPAVGGAIVGVRLGYRDHIEDNKKVFSFSLDEEDLASIAKVTKSARSLFSVIGDCGDEYRRRM